MKNFMTSTLIAAALTIIPATLFAATPITLEGSFEGAGCMLYNKTCPADMSDGHIALEADFVFVLANGEYVFVPNLDRGLKIKYLHAKLKLIGKKNGDAVRAEVVEMNKKGTFKKVWSLEEQEEERRRMNRK